MRRLLPLLALTACSPTVVEAPAVVEPFKLAVGERTELTLSLADEGEAVLELTGSLTGASWATPGAESVTLRLVVDNAVLRHLVWATGPDEQKWRVGVGRLAAGPHAVRVEVSTSLTRAAAATISVASAKIALHEDQELARYAPIILGRDGSAFNDSPLLLYGTRGANGSLRYTVIYTNEDGGTGSDPRQLVARWGRLTDIEWVVEVEHDAAGAITSLLFQGLAHLTLPFNGPREADHALARVATTNGTFADDGYAAKFHLAPAVIPFDDAHEPRERLMDLNPWLHRVAQEEGEREGKVDPACVDATRVWANHCYLYVDVDTTTQNIGSERRVWGLEAQTPTGARRSEVDLGAPGRLDRGGTVRVAIPVGSGSASAVRLYDVADGAGPFDVKATNPRAWRVTDESVVPAMANPAATAEVSEAIASAPLLP